MLEWAFSPPVVIAGFPGPLTQAGMDSRSGGRPMELVGNGKRALALCPARVIPDAPESGAAARAAQDLADNDAQSSVGASSFVETTINKNPSPGGAALASSLTDTNPHRCARDLMPLLTELEVV